MRADADTVLRGTRAYCAAVDMGSGDQVYFAPMMVYAIDDADALEQVNRALKVASGTLRHMVHLASGREITYDALVNGPGRYLQKNDGIAVISGAQWTDHYGRWAGVAANGDKCLWDANGFVCVRCGMISNRDEFKLVQKLSDDES